MHPSIHHCYLYIHLSFFLSVCPYFNLCTYDIYLPIHRSIYLLIYLSIYIDIIFLYLHFLICSYKDQSINIFTYLSSHLPTYPPNSPIYSLTSFFISLSVHRRFAYSRCVLFACLAAHLSNGFCSISMATVSQLIKIGRSEQGKRATTAGSNC